MDLNIELTNPKGIKIRGVYSLPDNKNIPLPVIVMATGYGLKGSTSDTWKQLSQNFLLNGIGTLLFDFTGQGKSDGEIKDSVPFSALNDLKIIIDNLRNLEGVDLDRIGLLGSSFGGYIALLYCANYGGVKLLGLKSPVSDYAEVRKIQLGETGIDEWKRNKYRDFDSFQIDYEFFLQSQSIDIYNRLAKLINIKTLIVHGDADTNVPISQSILLDKLLPNSELKRIPGAGHGYSEGDSFQIMINSFIEWFVLNI